MKYHVAFNLLLDTPNPTFQMNPEQQRDLFNL